MARKEPLPELSRAEFDILRVLWKGGKLTVREVHEELSGTHRWAYSTTKTMMDRMAKKRLLAREAFHGIYLYRPLISKPVGLVKFVRFFADRVLELDYGAVISLFGRSKVLTSEEIEELQHLLDEERKRGD